MTVWSHVSATIQMFNGLCSVPTRDDSRRLIETRECSVLLVPRAEHALEMVRLGYEGERIVSRPNEKPGGSFMT